jgi:hypothetical protein
MRPCLITAQLSISSAVSTASQWLCLYRLRCPDSSGLYPTRSALGRAALPRSIVMPTAWRFPAASRPSDAFRHPRRYPYSGSGLKAVLGPSRAFLAPPRARAYAWDSPSLVPNYPTSIIPARGDTFRGFHGGLSPWATMPARPARGCRIPGRCARLAKLPRDGAGR